MKRSVLWPILLAAVTVLPSCFFPLRPGARRFLPREVSMLSQARRLPTNRRPLQCYLLPPVSDRQYQPYMLVRFDQAFQDLTWIKMVCRNRAGREVVIERACDGHLRLHYAALNGTFSDPSPGNPIKHNPRNLREWHLNFAGGPHYSEEIPLVQIIFWCQSRDNRVTNAFDPEHDEPGPFHHG